MTCYKFSRGGGGIFSEQHTKRSENIDWLKFQIQGARTGYKENNWLDIFIFLPRGDILSDFQGGRPFPQEHDAERIDP